MLNEKSLWLRIGLFLLLYINRNMKKRVGSICSVPAHDRDDEQNVDDDKRFYANPIFNRIFLN